MVYDLAPCSILFLVVLFVWHCAQINNYDFYSWKKHFKSRMILVGEQFGEYLIYCLL